MKLPAKIYYACKALLELGLRWPSTTPLQINVIAESQGIPTKFLTHILIELKQLGYVQSIRGKAGGYILSKPPKEITLNTIIQQFGGDNCFFSQGAKIESIVDEAFSEIDEAIIKITDQMNLEAMCNRHRSKEQAIMFEI